MQVAAIMQVVIVELVFLLGLAFQLVDYFTPGEVQP
jgi:hypothetical protein